MDDTVIDHAEAAFHEWEHAPGAKHEPGVRPVVRFDARAKASAEARRARRLAERQSERDT